MKVNTESKRNFYRHKRNFPQFYERNMAKIEYIAGFSTFGLTTRQLTNPVFAGFAQQPIRKPTICLTPARTRDDQGAGRRKPGEDLSTIEFDRQMARPKGFAPLTPRFVATFLRFTQLLCVADLSLTY